MVYATGEVRKGASLLSGPQASHMHNLSLGRIQSLVHQWPKMQVTYTNQLAKEITDFHSKGDNSPQLFNLTTQN